MGARLNMVPLNQLKFDIVPDEFREEAYDLTFNLDDPELPYLQRLYADCYLSVFHCNPLDNVFRYKEDIARNARQAECSVRMFMLANMVAHGQHEKTVIDHTEKNRAAKFHARLLAADLSIKRAKMYQELCHDRFGTFSLTSLAVLTDTEAGDDLESAMLRSEVTMAQWLVRYRIFHSEEAETRLYENLELQLAPEWLAIEQTYLDHILKPYIQHAIRGTELVERHRFSTFQVHAFYKKHLTNQRLAWCARQRILPEALRTVVNSFGLQPEDLLHPREPVRSPMELWKHLALAIRHYHCWLYLNGEPSYFTPRRNENLTRL
jgi:hypothetical protein